jgi:CBS domain-containing protein
MGGAAGTALSALLPSGTPAFWALLGMAACMSGAMRVPLTATFFAAEVTGNTHVLLPLLTAATAAYTVTVLIMPRSILTEKLTRRGHHVVCEYDVNWFALRRARDIMTVHVETISADMTLLEATRFLTRPTTKHPSFPVVDTNNHVVGMIDPPTLLKWRRKGIHRKTKLAELCAASSVVFAYPDEPVERVAQRLSEAAVGHVPVISRKDSVLVGYIGWKDILKSTEIAM